MTDRLRKGDRVVRVNEEVEGTVVHVKERGVAGSGTTYIEYVEVKYDDGRITTGDPRYFRKIDEGR